MIPLYYISTIFRSYAVFSNLFYIFFYYVFSSLALLAFGVRFFIWGQIIVKNGSEGLSSTSTHQMPVAPHPSDVTIKNISRQYENLGLFLSHHLTVLITVALWYILLSAKASYSPLHFFFKNNYEVKQTK